MSTIVLLTFKVQIWMILQSSDFNDFSNTEILFMGNKNFYGPTLLYNIYKIKLSKHFISSILSVYCCLYKYEPLH